MKRYNTPHRCHVVKTRMTEEEYSDFTERLEAYDISQAEYIHRAITKATIRPVATVSPGEQRTALRPGETHQKILEIYIIIFNSID